MSKKQKSVVNQLEKKTVVAMISLYCRKKHAEKTLCTSCSEMLDYALCRLDACVYGKNKPTCSHCPIHCYKPEMRRKIRDVMRYSGPRMSLHYPFLVLRHFVSNILSPSRDRSHSP